jgi:hypothetical protein
MISAALLEGFSVYLCSPTGRLNVAGGGSNREDIPSGLWGVSRVHRLVYSVKSRQERVSQLMDVDPYCV